MRGTLLALTFLAVHAAAQQPRVDAISPGEGPIAGGTVVSIHGANFSGARVTIDRAGVVPLAQSDSRIDLRMPPHDNGFATIAIGSDSSRAYARFLYRPPRLDELPPGSITTVAGVGRFIGEFGPATAAAPSLPWGLAFDPAGRLYFADTNANRVFRVGENGILEPFAGNGSAIAVGLQPTVPTPATDVTIAFTRSIAFDSRGNLIVPDDDFYLWRVDPSGRGEIIGGTGRRATSAQSGIPIKDTPIGQMPHIAIDRDDNIYTIEWITGPNQSSAPLEAHIRKIGRDGIITTIAGNGTVGFSGDGGPAINAQFALAFNDLGALAVDPDGNILVLDYGNRRIRRIEKTTGRIDTIIGPTVNGRPLNDMWALAVAPNGDIYFANIAEIYRRASDGTITMLTSGQPGFSPDGADASTARVGLIRGLAFDSAGNLVFSDPNIGRVRKIDRTTNTISTVVGMGPAGFGEGGDALAANVCPWDVDFLPWGEAAFIGQNGIFKIDGAGKLLRIAGSGQADPQWDVPALHANISGWSLFVNANGRIDFAGGLNVSRIDPDGMVRQSAGSNAALPCAFSGDGGDARAAGFCQINDAIRDGAGNLLIADTNNNRVRRVDAITNVVTTIAGSGPVNGLERYGAGTTCGDGGPATSACINTPFGLAVDDRQNLYVCENESRIRQVDAAGTIRTFADVHCTKLLWAYGSLFTVAADHVVRISRTGTITPLTAVGKGFSGDGGPATAAHLFAPLQSVGIAADREGNLFFVDGDNLRIRAIRFGAVLPPPNATVTAAADGDSIRTTVRDARGQPAEGVRVDFSAPSIGAGCTLSARFSITDATGVASTRCTPNCTTGTYDVTARVVGGPAAVVARTNSDGPCRRRTVRH